MTLSAASGQQVTVNYADAGTGTASSGTDYTALTAGTLTFAAGETSKTITVAVRGDALDEADETVEVKLSGAVNATIATATGTGTITDDDAAPTLSITSPSVGEGNSGTANLTFRVSLSAASGRQVTVNYADAGTGTATSGTDYEALAAGTLTFEPGETSKTIVVSVTGDTLNEPDETVEVTLSRVQTMWRQHQQGMPGGLGNAARSNRLGFEMGRGQGKSIGVTAERQERKNGACSYGLMFRGQWSW